MASFAKALENANKGFWKCKVDFHRDFPVGTVKALEEFSGYDCRYYDVNGHYVHIVRTIGKDDIFTIDGVSYSDDSTIISILSRRA